MDWESSGVVGFDLGPLLQGQTRIAKLFFFFLMCLLDICTTLQYKKSDYKT